MYDFPLHFQIVAEVCGNETERFLIKELLGIILSNPLGNSSCTLIERNAFENAKEIPIKKKNSQLGMNKRKVANILEKSHKKFFQI